LTKSEKLKYKKNRVELLILGGVATITFEGLGLLRTGEFTHRLRPDLPEAPPLLRGHQASWEGLSRICEARICLGEPGSSPQPPRP